jgi:hypothetical protein
MIKATSALTAAIVIVLAFSRVSANGFLGTQRTALRRGAAAFMSDVSNAMEHVLGCGGGAQESDLASIERSLQPIWRVLPKNGHGRIERRMLRYLVYRHFMRQSSLLVRGFEQTPPANASDWASAEILSQRVPAFVESVLGHESEHGFDLRDAAYVVAALEQLVFDSEDALLEEAYREQGWPAGEPLSPQSLELVLLEYTLRWIVGDNPDGVFVLQTNKSMATTVIPHWPEVAIFVKGEIKAYDRERQRAARAGTGAMSLRYSLGDVHQIVGRIVKGFASFWRSECDWMQEALVRMDSRGTGRVPLSRFYSGTLGGEWRFSESESYLRDMGALDETSAWRGKEVIIPNYIQAASNCMVTGPHYLLCCQGSCGDILAEVEAGIGGPTASPGEIFALMQNISVQTTVFDEEATVLSRPLRSQLEEIAAAHGGQVPVHGRLFAQWLHYVFPRECPFPHRAGTVKLLTPGEYQEEYLAAASEMESHVIGARPHDGVNATVPEAEWMSQWSAEEELIADYAGHLRSPWWRSWKALVGLAAALTTAAALKKGLVCLGGKSATAPDGLPFYGKAHLI